MADLSLFLALLFTLYIGLIRPLLRQRRYQKFCREVATNPALRAQYYLETLVEPWLWLVVIGIVLLLNSTPLSVIGLQAPNNWEYTLWLLVEVVVLLPIVIIVLRYRIAKTQQPGLARLILDVKELLPHTAYERRLWLLISITAGICEEIVFRGFLPVYFFVLGNFFGLQVPLVVSVILSSILFGFAHIYQGWRGALGAIVVGATLAYLYIYTNSLMLPIIFHILIDARIVFLAPALLKLDRPVKA
jgi:membrane protease YdiL (CAAX protease family)